MVLLGGLEVFAAGYLIHQHQKNKKERHRLEEEEEEYERQRARHERRRERREKRSESAPPSEYRPSKDTKCTYSSPPPVKPQSAPRPAPRPSRNPPHWVPLGPPPPVQYTPRPGAAAPQPSRTSQSASPPTYKTQPYFPPPPPAQSAPPTEIPEASQSSYDLPPDAYEMSAGEVPQQYLYANTHIHELRSPSPPLGERQPFGSGRRRSRSSSRVRFALPVEGDEGRLVEVTPGVDGTPVSPPPPYQP